MGICKERRKENGRIVLESKEIEEKVFTRKEDEKILKKKVFAIKKYEKKRK